MTLLNVLQISYLPISDLKNYDRAIRKPGKKQIEKTMRLIEYAGFSVPPVVDKDNRVIVGDVIVEAARRLNMEEIPVVFANHLTDEQARLLRIAYSRLAEEESWDKAQLSAEFQDLSILYPEIDLTLTGFEAAEIDLVIDFDQQEIPKEEEIPAADDGPTVSQPGDLFVLGNHKIFCGDSRSEASYIALIAGQQAQMTFWDPPYNVRIDGHVCGLGSVKHAEFAMASGEMSEEEFTKFLLAIFLLVRAFSANGAIHFVCMDWRHTVELQLAARSAEFFLKNICVWVKDNGGMGSLYRSRHEFVFVFKHGDAPHINNVELGKHGRYRTNVWEFPGVNTMRAGRMEELAMHPTVKPVAMVTEAIKDCSKRGGIILDPFGGSGTTLIACEKAGRHARLIEIDPKYVDVTIRRWQKLTGQKAVLVSTGQCFDDIAPGSRAVSLTEAAE